MQHLCIYLFSRVTSIANLADRFNLISGRTISNYCYYYRSRTSPRAASGLDPQQAKVTVCSSGWEKMCPHRLIIRFSRWIGRRLTRCADNWEGDRSIFHPMEEINTTSQPAISSDCCESCYLRTMPHPTTACLSFLSIILLLG